MLKALLQGQGLGCIHARGLYDLQDLDGLRVAEGHEPLAEAVDAVDLRHALKGGLELAQGHAAIAVQVQELEAHARLPEGAKARASEHGAPFLREVIYMLISSDIYHIQQLIIYHISALYVLYELL